MLPTPSVSPLGRRIQDRLKIVGLSASRASILAGESRAFIRNITNGNSQSPRSVSLSKLAIVLQCDINWLIDGNLTANHLTAQLETLKQQSAVKLPSLQEGGAA
jgi:transcriptional regulator with XRE-family HTH domain